MPNTPNIVTRETYTNQQTVPPNNTAEGWGYWESMSEAPSAAAYGVGPAWIGGRLYWSDGVSWTQMGIGKYADLNPLFIELASKFPTSNVPLGINANTAAYADLTQAAEYTFDNSGFGATKAALVVSGAAGEYVLSCAPNTTQFANIVADAAPDSGNSYTWWAGVLQHVDGSYGVYSVTAVTANSATIRPALKKPVANSPLCNFFHNRFSQHLTRNGYRAMVDAIINESPVFARRQNYAYVWNETQTAAGNTAEGAAAWVSVGGYNIASSTFNNYVNPSLNSVAYCHPTWARTRYVASHSFTSSGHGVRKTIPVTSAGWLETWIGIASGSFPFVVSVYADYGLGTQRTLYTNPAFYGMECLRIPFGDGLVNVSIEIIRHSTATGTTAVDIGTTYIYPRQLKYDPYIFPPSSRGVWMGDSWGNRNGQAVATEMNRRLSPIGTSIESVSLEGQTTAWALANFAALVVPKKPDFVCFEYFTNDLNGVGGMTQGQWIANLKTLCGMARAAGIKPIIIGPIPSSNQNAILGGMAGNGALIDAISTESGWYS